MPFTETYNPEVKPFYSSPKFWRWILGLGLIVSFWIAFRYELMLVWQLTLAYISVFLGYSVVLPLTPETFRAGIILGLNILIVFGGYFLILFWISPFVLPTRGRSETWRAFCRLCMYTLPGHSHGPAVLIKDGKPLASKEELDDPKAGIAFVDLHSAVVLEQQWGTIDTEVPEVYFDQQSQGSSTFASTVPNYWRKILSKLGLATKAKKTTRVRVFGPGLVFTQGGEKIIGWADLRKQSRTRKDVYGCTRDGIEIKTNVSTTFTLGQPAEILYITKVNGNWLVVQLDDIVQNNGNNQSGAQQPNRIIKDLSDEEIEIEDKTEIDSFFESSNYEWSNGDSESEVKKNITILPFGFDANRVFDAIYSRARDAKAGLLGEWTDLPVDVATEIFRNMLAHQNYDELYRQEDPLKYPLKKFKATFRKAVRNKGILGYQIVRRKDGQPLSKGQAWTETELEFSSPQEFQRSKVLRDRGIKIISASFSDLTPTNETIRQQLLENWQAHWQKETEMTIASGFGA